MSNKYPCIYYDNGKCQKFSDEQYSAWCDFDSCESRTPSNGDRIRGMSDKELSVLFCAFCATSECRTEGDDDCPFIDDCPMNAPGYNSWLDWLRKPAKESGE